jgi:hypothetical protein
MVVIPALTLALVARPEHRAGEPAHEGITAEGVAEAIAPGLRGGPYNAPACGCIPTYGVTGDCLHDGHGRAWSGWTPGCAVHPKAGYR